MRKFILLVIPIFIILIFSCRAPGGPEDLPPPEESVDIIEEETDTKTVKSIAPGEFVSKEDSIPVEIDFGALEREPSELVINLLSTSGKVLASQKHFFEENPEKGGLPDLLLPDISEGEYLLRYEIYDVDGELFYSEEVPFFYITKKYGISGIRTYPNAIFPGSSAMLKAGISAPKESNPYLLWRLSDTVIAEGYLSEGTNLFSWVAPDVEGIYSLSLEIFPVKPENNVTFSSKIRMSTEIYVTSEPSPERTELQPEEYYYSLYHFRGNVLDTGYRERPAKTGFIGSPELRLSGEIYGYYLDGRSGFTVPELILPLNEGRLLPFSLVMQGVLEPFGPEQSFFSSTTKDGSFSFTLKSDVNRRLQVVIENGNDIAVSTLPESVSNLFTEREDAADSIIVSVVPQREIGSHPDRIDILWYLQHALTHRESVMINTAVDKTEGSTVIGGKDGFKGLLDEAGIYHRKGAGGNSSIIEDVYQKVLQAEYGIDLRFAEGFDGMTLPPELTYSGNVSLKQGRAEMAGGSGISLPPLLLRNERIDVRIDFYDGLPEREEFFCEVLFPETEIPGVRIDGAGNVYAGETEVYSFPSGEEKNTLKFTLAHDSGGVILILGEKRVELYDSPKGSVNVRLSLQNNTDNTVSIEGVSIISTSLEIVQKSEDKGTSDDLKENNSEAPLKNSSLLTRNSVKGTNKKDEIL